MHDDHPDTPQGPVSRWLGWLLSPTTWHLVGFVMATGLGLAMFNPYWGAIALAWPHEVFTDADGSFIWSRHAAMAATMMGLVLCFVTALLMRPGRGRGAVALFGIALLLVAFTEAPDLLPLWTLPLASAWVGGCLLVRGGGFAHKAALLIGLAALTANLFMPWPELQMRSHELEPGYHSTFTYQWTVLTEPREDLLEFLPEDGGPAERKLALGYARLLVMSMPQMLGVLFMFLGLLGVFGLTRSWGRWVALLLLACLPVTLAVIYYDAGLSAVVRADGEAPWQTGLQMLGSTLPEQSGAWMLMIAAAVADLVGRRPS